MTKRAELILIFSCTIIFFTSFFVAPLFPVQRYPLFADAPLRYEKYVFTTPTLEEIPAQSLELQNTYDGDPTYLVGRLPKTSYLWSNVLSHEQIQTHFESLEHRQLLKEPTICIQRIIWSTLADGAFGPSVIDNFVWTNKAFSNDQNLVRSLCDAGVPQ